jgi:hypothetical protein
LVSFSSKKGPGARKCLGKLARMLWEFLTRDRLTSV